MIGGLAGFGFSAAAACAPAVPASLSFPREAWRSSPLPNCLHMNLRRRNRSSSLAPKPPPPVCRVRREGSIAIFALISRRPCMQQQRGGDGDRMEWYFRINLYISIMYPDVSDFSYQDPYPGAHVIRGRLWIRGSYIGPSALERPVTYHNVSDPTIADSCIDICDISRCITTYITRRGAHTDT